MTNLNGVGIDSRGFTTLYGDLNEDIVRSELCEPIKIKGKNGTTTIEKFSLQLDGGLKPYGSQKVVTLPENSPLRRLNLDKFELTKEKFPILWDDNVAPGLKKTLKLFNKNGQVMFEGADSIRQFMKSIAHVIRKG